MILLVPIVVYRLAGPFATLFVYVRKRTGNVKKAQLLP
jgi:hypothetical protein